MKKSVSNGKIFLSFSSHDAQRASLIDNHIKNSLIGIETFFSQDENAIPSGEWRDVVMKNLNEANALVIVASSQSIKSPWVIFEYGFFYARNEGKAIHILRIDDVETPDPLNIFQAKDARKAESLQAFTSALAKDTGSEISTEINYEETSKAISPPWTIEATTVRYA